MTILTAIPSAEPVDLDVWRPLVAPHVKGCPDLAIRQEVLRAAIQFCERTRAWKAVPPPVDIDAEVATYPVPTPCSASCVIVEQALYDGRELIAQTTDQLTARFGPRWMPTPMTSGALHLKRGGTNVSLSPGTPQYFTQLNPNFLVLVAPPATALRCGLIVRGSYRPDRASTTLPGFLWDQYADEIADLAIAALCAVPGLPWSNPEAAAYRAAQGEAAIGRVSRDASKNFSRAPSRVRLQSF